MSLYRWMALVGSGLRAKPRMTAFQSLVEGVWILRKRLDAYERSPEGDTAQNSRSLVVREG